MPAAVFRIAIQLPSVADARQLMVINVLLVLLIAVSSGGIALALVRRSMRERVKAARLAAMGTATARILHQVKNPLQTILLHAEMLNDETLVSDPEIRAEVCEAITGEAKRMSDLLAELSAYASGVGRRVHREPMPLHTLVRDVVALVAREAERDRIQVKANPVEEIYVDGDPYFLRQALTNVLRNGLEALQGSGGTGRAKVEVGLRRRGAAAVIEVQDTGIGIAADRLPQVFEPFMTTKGKGMGLGLPICREIVEAHGGRVELRSQSDQGTTVQVILPARAEAGAPQPA